MDHATNSALYCTKAGDGILRLLGDARSASQAAANWRPGETAQKFHTRPLWHQGRIYVATLDRSTPDDGYLSRRGFHWYAYDPTSNVFSDLSAAEPGGAGAPHGGLVTLAANPDDSLIYGASVPTAEIFRYDIAKGRTDNLGRPHVFDSPYVYANRVMWLDAGVLPYFTAGNPSDPVRKTRRYTVTFTTTTPTAANLVSGGIGNCRSRARLKSANGCLAGRAAFSPTIRATSTDLPMSRPPGGTLERPRYPRGHFRCGLFM